MSDRWRISKQRSAKYFRRSRSMLRCTRQCSPGRKIFMQNSILDDSRHSAAGSNEVLQRAARVKMLLMDVDGVLTDGTLWNVPGPDGKMVETKGFDSQD